MQTKLDKLITELIAYALREGLIEEGDAAYAVNRILEIFGAAEYVALEPSEERALSEILADMCDTAFEAGIIESNTVVYRDLFDTRVMGALVDRPSAVVSKFYSLYEQSPKAATDYFYHLACSSNYIRTDRIKRDRRWVVDSEYGEIDITINLSKPEKDPKAIAAAKLLPPSKYPKCLLCRENEGYAGTLSHPARQNIRLIPFDMDGAKWYLQYSPYVYYNEHCIALSAEHTPMQINRSSFAKILGFVEKFPHYFIGSNAWLPIVGGSILSHDHMQGGCYTFAMERAGAAKRISFSGYEDIDASIVKWPLSVIRLTGADKEKIIDLADKIRVLWTDYTDEEAFVFAYTDGEPHNAITPIARRRGELFELDLVLRNNITTEARPAGLYHPREEYHNIKKENIGLIEVMGLAVLPARLATEMELVKRAILDGVDFDTVEAIAKHKAWYLAFKDKYNFTEENIDGILKEEIGATFVNCLRDAGVYKDSDEGRRLMMKFIDCVNQN